MALSTFQKFDGDGNGVLDKDEFKKCVNEIFKNSKKKHFWKDYWKNFNTDIFDGINLKEFLAFINSVRSMKGYSNEHDDKMSKTSVESKRRRIFHIAQRRHLLANLVQNCLK